VAGLSLKQLLPEFPDVSVEKVEYLTHLGAAREAGVRTIPTMIAGDQKIDGIYLTKNRIRKFLESL
jgi:hypothetical protein